MSSPQNPQSFDAGGQVLRQGLAAAAQAERAGNPAEAERVLRGLLASFPSALDVLNSLGVLLKNRGRYAESETFFRQAIALAPRVAPLHNNLGNLQRRAGDSPAAERSYRAAIALKADYAQAHYNLAVALQDQKRIDEMLVPLRQACRLEPQNTEALTLLGAVCGERGEAEKSLAALDAAVASNPVHFGAHYYRGVVLTSLSRFDEAIAMLERAVALRPDSFEGYFALGNALSRAERLDQALAAYAKVVEIAPEYLDGHYAYNLLAWTMGRADLNLASYGRARARVGEKPDLLLAEADQRLFHREAPAAEALLRRAHEIAPERTDIANALARALSMQQRFGDAVALLERAVAAEPSAIRHRRELGSALLQDRQLTQARTVLEEALALDRYDQLSSAYLMLVYRELGDSKLERLADIARYVRVFDIEPPAGFSDIESFHRILREDLMSLHTRSVEPFDQTLRGGTQTMGHLFSRRMRAIQPLYERLNEAVADYIRDLPDDPSQSFLARKNPEFGYSGAWSARLKSGGYHANHVHPMGWVSSAYYVSLPDAVEQATDQQGWLKFGESNLGLGERDRPLHLVKPKVGRLVLFPSYFWHGTVPFASTDTRLTVAFDVAPGKQPIPRM
ncbi:MAG: tetratricopeptide repeat protein [Rhizomicrobium sp.]